MQDTKYNVRCRACGIIAHNLDIAAASNLAHQHRRERKHNNVQWYKIPTPVDTSKPEVSARFMPLFIEPK